jgi:flavin-dependent dehydrogenase
MNDFIFDACVVGGGPAGLAAAIAIQRQGLKATVLDRALPPIDKACGEALMPDGIPALKELGIELPAGAGFRFRGIRFLHGSGGSIAADFPNASGLAVRRIALHELLIQAAERAGVALQWGVKNVYLDGNSIVCGGRVLKARWIIGADGQNSRIRQQAGLDLYRTERRRYGFRQHYRIAPWSSYMELYWDPRCQVYVTPIAEDEVGIAVISHDSNLRVREALTGFPDLERRISGTPAVSREMGALSVTRRLRSVCRGRMALIGDASGSVDAITGDGICLSFKQALVLAEAVKNKRLNDYQTEHAKLNSRPHLMASLMLAMAKHGRLQRRVLASLAKRPGVFELLLAIHVGQRSFLDLWPRGVFAFGAGLLGG